ncbi:MAG: ABC transporter ATP-binding protein [Anaerocolumna sp.]
MELKIENVSKKYRDKKALDNLNLTLNNGVYGLLGENGAGKSTLMRILAIVDFQTKGAVYFNGEEITKLDKKYREIVGYLPQDFYINPSFTAKSFLEYIGVLKGMSKIELKKIIPEVLEFVNLSHVADKKISKFSGGMRRRIGIAQTIMNDPKIVILDEPTVGLDPKERIRFSNIISSMSKDKIVILSTHIVSDIEAIANNVIIIKSGEIIESGKINALVQTVDGRIFESLVDEDSFMKIHNSRKVIRRKQVDEKILVRYSGERYKESESYEVDPTLEDYYMSECL